MNLHDIPSGETVLVDANIVLHGARQKSAQCARFLHRCAERDVQGIVGMMQMAEVMHRLMMFEVHDAGWTGSGNPTRTVSRHPERVRGLAKYAESMKALLASAIRLEPLQKEDFAVALLLQRQYGFLTNDAFLIALSDRLRIGAIASADRAFDRVHGERLYVPDDIA